MHPRYLANEGHYLVACPFFQPEFGIQPALLCNIQIGQEASISSNASEFARA